MAFTRDVTKRIDIPDGAWVVIRQLSWYQLAQAADVRGLTALGKMAKPGATLDDLTRIKDRSALDPPSFNPFENVPYDLQAVLASGVVNASGTDVLSRDSATAERVGLEILRFSGVPEVKGLSHG